MAFFSGKIIAWFGEIDQGDSATAGGKGARLSDMTRFGFPVPPGFVVCTEAFQYFLEELSLKRNIEYELKGLNVEDSVSLSAAAARITQIILESDLPENLQTHITKAYHRLCDESGGQKVVAVRSSATAEDSQAASFAGQQETYLNIFGEAQILEKIRSCWASFFQPRAIFYRKQRGSLTDLGIAVVVQRMITPDKSGVMFTADPVQRRIDHVMIEGAWGLGDAVVSGLVTPDNYIVNKRDGSIVSSFVSRKPVMIVREENGLGIKTIEVSPEQAVAQVLNANEISRLMELGNLIEAHFGGPQDVEWGIEGSKIFILQSRPVTTM